MPARKTSPARPTSSKPATKAAARPEPAARGDALTAWSRAQSPSHRAICDTLRPLIDAALPKASARVWHGAPVWFLGENPVVGYSAKAGGVSLLFWNGVAFKEPELKPVGKYGAAEARYGDVAELDAPAIRRWLRKARTDVFDSQAFFKKRREGK